MNNYLITYRLRKSYYMEPFTSDKVEIKSIIVEAESEELAKKTLEKYWDNKSDQYGESYTIQEMNVWESIKQTEILLDKKK